MGSALYAPPCAIIHRRLPPCSLPLTALGCCEPCYANQNGVGASQSALHCPNKQPFTSAKAMSSSSTLPGAAPPSLFASPRGGRLVGAIPCWDLVSPRLKALEREQGLRVQVYDISMQPTRLGRNVLKLLRYRPFSPSPVAFLHDIRFQMAQAAVPAANATVCDQALLLSPLIPKTGRGRCCSVY